MRTITFLFATFLFTLNIKAQRAENPKKDSIQQAKLEKCMLNKKKYVMENIMINIPEVNSDFEFINRDTLFFDDGSRSPRQRNTRIVGIVIKIVCSHYFSDKKTQNQKPNIKS